MSPLPSGAGFRDTFAPFIKRGTSHARKRHASYVKRPLNAFFLFRKHVCDNWIIKRGFYIQDQRTISRVVAEMWRKLTVEHKEQWHEVFRKEKESFLKMHPEYKYQPDTSSRRKKTRRLRKEQQTKQDCISIAEAILQSSAVTHNSKNAMLESKVLQVNFGRMNACENICSKDGQLIVRHALLKMEDHAENLQVDPSETYQMPLLFSEPEMTSQKEQLYPSLWEEPTNANIFEFVDGTASDLELSRTEFNRHTDCALGFPFQGWDIYRDNDYWTTDSVPTHNFLSELL